MAKTSLLDPPCLELEFVDAISSKTDTSTTFRDNLSLPVHRWFKYSAGFSATWVASVIKDLGLSHSSTILDPFVGSGTTIIEAEFQGIKAIGIDSHPFVARIAQAKLCWRDDREIYINKIRKILADVRYTKNESLPYPKLVLECYSPESLKHLDALRHALIKSYKGDAASKLAWLTLIAILRSTSQAGTAQWQYILPKKQKKKTLDPLTAFELKAQMFYADMGFSEKLIGPRAEFRLDDARECSTIADNSVDCVITSPPYPNNYDYADATRLEMCFLKEISGWSDLQETVRKNLVRSCTQHVPPKSIDIDSILDAPELWPIRNELRVVCDKLTEIRLTKGGKKTYNNMIACYYLDMAKTWIALRRVCKPSSTVCFVIGDSAPYGIYAPAVEWMGLLAISAGFKSWRFEKTRDRNIKWKNRKHRVPLQEGRLWVQG